MTDPDGGGTQTVTASTAIPLAQSAAAGHYFAVPGDGGGSGSQADPFRGLQAACDVAAPGAIIHVAAGVYDAFELTASGEPNRPIVLRGPVDPHAETDGSQWAVVDGADTDRGEVNTIQARIRMAARRTDPTIRAIPADRGLRTAVVLYER